MPEEHMSFESRKTLEVMDTTSEPVLRVPMPFVELAREIDSTDPTKKKKIVKTERCMLNSRDPRVSTHMHPLARYLLYDGGSADADCQGLVRQALLGYSCQADNQGIEGVLSRGHENDQALSKQIHLG